MMCMTDLKRSPERIEDADYLILNLFSVIVTAEWKIKILDSLEL